MSQTAALYVQLTSKKLDGVTKHPKQFLLSDAKIRD